MMIFRMPPAISPGNPNTTDAHEVKFALGLDSTYPPRQDILVVPEILSEESQAEVLSF
jgi:hypothetical protein